MISRRVSFIPKYFKNKKIDFGSVYAFDRDVNEAVEFALFEARTFIDWLPGKEEYLRNKWFLEIGPGQNFGLALIAMGFGAKVMLVDRYMAGWVNKFHAKFYGLLRENAKKTFPGLDVSPLENIVESNGYDIDGLVLIKKGLEDLDFIKSDLIDVSYSNATFEHLSNIPAAIGELYRISNRGGVGFHQIDFRDHRSFKTPLDHLTLTEKELDQMNIELHNKVGTDVRPEKFYEVFHNHGFSIKFEANSFLQDDEYLTSLRPKIDSRFSMYTDESLRVLGGRYYITKD